MKMRQASWSAFDDHATRREEAERKRKTIEERTEKVKHDKLLPWKELASTAEEKPQIVEQRVGTSQDVLLQVSQGLYDAKVLFIYSFI